MKKISTLLLGCAAFSCAFAQPATPPRDFKDKTPADSWEMTVREMPQDVREAITDKFKDLRGIEDYDRSLIADLGNALGLGFTSAVVDMVFTETYNLAQYKKKQKQEWMRMIQNENNYTDSITNIKGINDFYASKSHKGALDPSDINFNGVEIRGMRDGQEVIYMACSIDRDKLDHLFRHSKFNLVLDTLAFNPYVCHLPNVTANGITTMEEIKKGKSDVRGDVSVITRPGIGGNGFSFEERNDLKIAVDFSLYSSWINQLVQMHKNVELGNFSFEVSIPDTIIGTYNYSRRDILNELMKLPEGKQRDSFLAANIIPINGDSFVVPRSYMPLDTGRPMWGTGEYNIKVKVRESCRLDSNGDKARNWKEDYKRLRQMQKRSGEVREYFQTLWNQYGNTLVKTSYKTVLTTTANDVYGKIKGTPAASAPASKSAKAPASTKP